MVSRDALTRLQWLVWIAIYGGLLTVVLGTFVGRTDATTAFWMYLGGAVLVLLGCVLIYVRSRLHESTGPAP